MKKSKSRLALIIFFSVLALSFLSVSSVYLVIGDMNKKKIESDTTNRVLLCDTIRIDSIKHVGSLPYLQSIDSLQKIILHKDSASSRKDSTIFNQRKAIDTLKTKYFLIKDKYNTLKYKSK